VNRGVPTTDACSGDEPAQAGGQIEKEDPATSDPSRLRS